MLNMKVEQTSRGGKKGAPRGRGRAQRKAFEKTDLVVTVPNDESGASRLKPPVNTTQPRKIVRLNQNKTETNDLEKVTVKSLDEIKREKEQRLKESAASAITSLATPASQTTNGGVSEGAGKDHSRKPETDSIPSFHGPVMATRAEPTFSSSTIKAKLPLKAFTIPLKALPALSSSNSKILHLKPKQTTVTSSTPEPQEVSMDLDSELPEQDFDYLDDDDDEDSDIDDEPDEDFLLRDDHDDMGTQEEFQTTRSQTREGTNDLGVNDDGFSGYTDTTDDLEDDEISLHPDDSLFDEEDEPTVNNERLRPRSLGRRSGSESRDLRSKLSDRQKQSQDSSNSTVKRTEDHTNSEMKETEDEKQKTTEDKEKSVHVPRKTDRRERNLRSSTRRSSSREQDERHGPRTLRSPRGKKRGGAKGGNNVRGRSGHGLRQGPRKGSVPSVVPGLLGLHVPPVFPSGDGLLPLPGTTNVNLISPLQLQAAIMLNSANIENNIKATVEMLTNPPPVPGEVVTNYEKSIKQPSALHVETRDNIKTGAKRHQSSPPGVQNIRPLMELPTSKVPLPGPSLSQQKSSENVPKWLQRTLEGEKQSKGQGKGNHLHPGNTGGVLSVNEVTETDQNAALSLGVRSARLERTGFQGNLNSRPMHHSPTFDGNFEMEASPTKRKSSLHSEEMTHGGKVVVGTSPEGLPQPNPARVQKTYPRPLCSQQLQTGECKTKHCKFWHLSKGELEEYKRSQQLGHINRQDHLVEGQAEQEPPVAPQQMKQGVPEVSYDLVNALLKERKLGAAWQMIEKLRRNNHPPDLSTLQHVQYLCSKHVEEPDLAAQVACNAFDMIRVLVGQHNRHSYETLIKTLCHSGQYIRAYEMLDVMKKDGHAPTYEVFLDLVKASEKDPDWAFSLLDEIKQAGVFKSKICSDLILLGCSSGENFVERTWLLFQEALESQFPLTPEAVSAMLFTLLKTDDWEKIMSVLSTVSYVIPMEILKPAVLQASRRVDWIEMIIQVLAVSPAEKLCELGADVWNTFLSNCCLTHGNNISFAQKIYSLMQQNGILLPPESLNNYLSVLSRGNWSAALELYNAVCSDPRVLEQPKVLEGGLIELSTALHKAKASDEMLSVVHFMLEYHIKPDDSVLQSAVEYLDNEKNYKGVLQFFNQLQAAAIVPPFSVYKGIVSSLEKWTENPTASYEPYVTMRRTYPGGEQSDTGNKKEVVNESEKIEHRGKPVCRFFGTPKGCFSGDKCRFLHPDGGASSTVCSHEGSHSVSLQSSDNIPAASVHGDQESYHVSGVESASGGSVTGSTIDRRPSNPFVLHSHDTRHSGIPAATSQVVQPLQSHQTSGNVVEPSPFALQTTAVHPVPFIETGNPGSSQAQAQFTPEDGPSSEHFVASVTSQSQKQGRQFCRYFGTPLGCRKGDSCRYIHHLGSASLPANSNPALPEMATRGSSEAMVRDNCSGNPFVLRGPPSSSGQLAGNALFGHIVQQQPTAASVGNAEPVSSMWQGPVAKPPSAVGCHHFQLAGSGHFKGTNPFSPTLSGRTRSMDGLGEQKSTEQDRQARSAPVVPVAHDASYFLYPSKKNIHFYLPRIKHAGQHSSWEDLAYVYISMKNEDVEIDSGVLEAFYQAFETFCPDAVGDCFERFASKVRYYLEEGMPEAAPNRSPSSSLDDGDKDFIGQLGVALMYFCYSKQCFTQGYNVLHVLHNFSINYSFYSGEFGMQKRLLTTTEVALTAADMCLHLDEPAYTSALEVLRGTNYALPANDSGALLTQKEAEWRRRVFQTLCKNFMIEKEFDFVRELLFEVGDNDVFGTRELKALYNELLIALINSSELDVATEVLKTMETNLISRDPETVRALVKGFGEAGRMAQAKQHFVSGRLSGVYPVSFNQGNPWTVVIGTSFSALESQLYLESHFKQLFPYIEELARNSGKRAVDDTYHRPLKVVVESDDETNASSKYMRREEIIRCVREMLCTVLTDDFNPPLSCEPQSNDEELIVDSLSLKRWFMANAASGRSKQGGFSVTTSSARSHPYLLPGMTNVNSQEREGRRVCLVSETEVAPGLPKVQSEQQLQHVAFMTNRGQRGKTRPVSSTRTVSGRGHAKEERKLLKRV